MVRKTAAITVLQFDDRSMSFMRVRPGLDRVEVLQSGVRTGGWSVDDGSLNDALREFVEEHEIDRDRVYSVFPRHRGAVRVMDLPSQAPSELSGMVQLNAGDVVPFPNDQLVTSYCPLETLPDGSSRVLAAVVHEDVMDEHLSMLEQAGIEPQKILLSTACLLDGLTPAESPKAYAHCLPSSVEIVVLRGDTFVYGRAAALSAEASESEDAYFREVSHEIRTTLSAFSREVQEGAALEALHIGSEFLNIDEASRVLSGSVGVECRPAAASVRSVAGGQEDLPGVPALLVGACRAALGLTPHAIDLTPKHVLERRTAARTRAQSFRMAAMVALALVALGAVYVQSYVQRSAYLEDLERRADAIRPGVQDLITKRRHLQRLQDQVDRTNTVLETMAAIVHQMPLQGMNLIRFDYRRDDRIRIHGRTLDYRLLDAFTDNLRAASATYPLFAQAQEIYRNQGTERDELVWDYEVAIPFPKNSEDAP